MFSQQLSRVSGSRKVIVALVLLAALGLWLTLPGSEPSSADMDAAQSVSADTGGLSTANTPEEQQVRSQGDAPARRQGAEALQASQAANEGAELAQAEDREISPRIGRSLSGIIELLNADNFVEARAQLDELMQADVLAEMSPYELSRVYQLAFNLNMEGDAYEAAQADLYAAIDSGGLNPQEVSQMEYQIAQLYVQMEDYAKAADSLELWIARNDAAPHNAAYYLLAASYYYQEKYDDARDHIETLMSMPGEKQEGWYAMASSLYIRNEDYAKATPVMEQMVAQYGRETYRAQLSGLYLQQGDYAKARDVVAQMVELYDKEPYRKQLSDLDKLLEQSQ